MKTDRSSSDTLPLPALLEERPSECESFALAKEASAETEAGRWEVLKRTSDRHRSREMGRGLANPPAEMFPTKISQRLILGGVPLTARKSTPMQGKSLAGGWGQTATGLRERTFSVRKVALE